MYKIQSQQLNGKVVIPPSKSIAHRAIICASLAQDSSYIYNVDYNDDIIATINCMKELGTYIEEREDCLFIDGRTTFFRNYLNFDVNASGSTLRFLLPISLIYQSNVRVIGDARLSQRDMSPYYDIFTSQELNFLYKKDVLEILVEGYLQPGEFKLPGNVSSQFISGLLFACPLMRGDSKIVLTSPLESKNYVDLTLDMLERFGIEIENHDYKEFVIKGNQKYIAQNYTIEADYSSASNYIVANALGANIEMDNLNPNSLQGDQVIFDYIKNNEVIDVKDCPDIAPILALYCALTTGEHKITHCERLKIKECDRLHVTVEVLSKLGANIRCDNDTMYITGVDHLISNTVSSHNDHRIAMMIAIASIYCDDLIIIDNIECVKKSYPNFFEDFKKLGGEVYEC